MRLLGVIVSGVGTLLGLAVIAFAILAELHNGCENGPCGSPLVLAIPGALIVCIFGGLGAYLVRDGRRPYEPQIRRDVVYNPPRDQASRRPPGDPPA